MRRRSEPLPPIVVDAGSWRPPLLDATSGARSSVVRRCDGGGLVPLSRAGQRAASRPEPICRGQAEDGHGKSGTRPESRGGSPMAALAPIGHLQLPQHERECHASSEANMGAFNRDSRVNHQSESDSLLTSSLASCLAWPASLASPCENFLYGFKAAPPGRSRRLSALASAPAAAPATAA